MVNFINYLFTSYLLGGIILNLDFLNERNSAILMILLGIIALLFPMISAQSIGLFVGIIVLIIALALLVYGIRTLKINQVYGVIVLIIALLGIVFAQQLFANPVLLLTLISSIVYIVGFLLIILGIIAFVNGSIFAPFSIIGLTTIFFGVITVLVGVFVHNPKVLGTVIGIWLIVSGLLSLFSDTEKNYIDI